jgi:hypothetical protein
VGSTGLVTGIAVGAAVITVTDPVSGVTAATSVTINTIKVALGCQISGPLLSPADITTWVQEYCYKATGMCGYPYDITICRCAYDSATGKLCP